MNSKLPRPRSSSSDSLSLLGRQSGPPARSSSISRPSQIARPSSINRQSMANKPGASEFTVTTHEMIRTIENVLDKGEFTKKCNQYTPKHLQPASASASIFFAIFEFLLNEIGIEEVWNPDLLNSGGGPSSSQSSSQQANNPAAQNKLRIELVIFHLNSLRMNNVPKPSVFQTMTSSNNWTKMLQLLYALCNDIKYLQIYTEKKLLFSDNSHKPRECVNEFMAKIYVPLSRDEGFRSTEEYMRLQKEALEKYEKSYKLGLNKQELEAERENLKKTYEHLYANRNELENLAQEEQSLVNSIQDDQTKLAKEAQELDERRQRIQIKKNELARLKEKVNQVEKEAVNKEALYDQQLAKNPDRSNIQLTHGQKVQELDKLQKHHLELDEVKDHLDCQLAKVTEEAKQVIQKLNEQENLVLRTTLVPIPDFPHINVVDVHRPINYVEESTKMFHKIRTKFNAETQKLPFEIYKVEEEKKQIERRIEANEVKIQQLKEAIQEHDAHLNLLGKRKEEAFREREASLNEFKRLFLESEAQLKGKEQEVAALMTEFDVEKEKCLEMANDLQAQLEAEHKEFEELKQKSVIEYEEKKNKVLLSLQNDMTLMKELKKSQEKEMQFLKSFIESCKKKHNF